MSLLTPLPSGFLKFISHTCRSNTLSSSHSIWMTSLLFSRKKIEIIRRGQLGKPSPDLLVSHCLYILPAFTLVTQGKYPCWCLHLEPRFQPLSCLQVHCSSNFLLICYSKGQHTFPAKGQIVSILGFMGLMIFVTVFQLKLYKDRQKSNQAGNNSLSIPVLYHQYIPQLDRSLSPQHSMVVL